MKKLILILSLFLFAVSLFAYEEISSNLPIERFALYVGCNDGGKSRERLLYAGSDAYNFQKTMAEIGGVPASNSQLLINPAKDDITNALGEFSERIEKRKTFTKRTEFIFYYSGHSDEDSILLGSTAYDYSSLKKAITEVPSDVHVVILDSCFSGNFIRAKGGKRSQAFLTDDSTIVQGHAYLSSSSSSESSQESDEIQSSFFTNAMLTGLRGAADTSRDNKVSLNELYYYAFNETLSKTENSIIGPQHPSYNITLVGTGDLILTDISQAESTVILQKNDSGKFIFRNSRGVLVSEINKQAGNQIAIALESDNYEVTVIGETSTKQGKFTLKQGETYVVSVASLKNIKRVKNTLRGDGQISDNGDAVSGSRLDEGGENDSDDGDDDDDGKIDDGIEIDNAESEKKSDKKSGRKSNGKSDKKSNSEKPEPDFKMEFKIQKKKNEKNPDDDEFDNDFEFDKRFNDESGNEIGEEGDLEFFGDAEETSDEHFFKFGLVTPLMVKTPTQKNDVSISLLVNSDERIGDFGFQMAALGNNVFGKMSGIQLAPLYNIANSVYGVQNSVFLNSTNGLSGLQLGLVNSAKLASGLQVGLFNFASTLRGVQIGVFNFANHADGLVLGLFNFVKDGVAENYFYWDSSNLFTSQYRGGTKELYTTVSYSFSRMDWPPFHLEFGFGFGTKAEVGWFCFDSEVVARLSVGGDFNANIYTLVYPSFRETITLGTGLLGAFCGISVDLLFPVSGDSFYTDRYDYAWIKGDGLHIDPSFYWGFKIGKMKKK